MKTSLCLNNQLRKRKTQGLVIIVIRFCHLRYNQLLTLANTVRTWLSDARGGEAGGLSVKHRARGRVGGLILTLDVCRLVNRVNPSGDLQLGLVLHIAHVVVGRVGGEVLHLTGLELGPVRGC